MSHHPSDRREPREDGPGRLGARRPARLSAASAPSAAGRAATALLLFASVALGGAGSACDDAEDAAADKGRQGPAVVPVKVATARVRPFQRTLVLEGNLEPAERILVAPSVPGVIRRITKRAGDRIKKGEVLVEVDPKEVYVGTIQLRVSLASAKAKARAADQVLQRLKAPRRRLRRLHKARAISKTQLDEVEIPFVKAKAERDAARRVIEKVKGELGIAYSKLTETKIKAPFDGYVVRRLADPGETARPFPPTVVLVVTRHDPLYVQAEVNESDVTRLAKGRKVSVHFDALPGQPPRPGVLEEIIPYVNPMSRTVTIRVRVDNPKGILMPGMSARVSVTLDPSRWLAVPHDALATEPLEREVSVFTVDAQGRAREQRIRFGRSQDGYVAVLEGLKPGAQVVVEGHERLLDETRVAVRGAATPPRSSAAANDTAGSSPPRRAARHPPVSRVTARRAPDPRPREAVQ